MQFALPVTVDCVCSAVRLECTAPPSRIVFCHCNACQKTSGTSLEHNARFEPHEVNVVKGEADLRSIDIPGFPVRRWYCRICQIRVLHDRLSDDGTVVRKSIPVGVVSSKAGDLDPAWAPSAHIFYGGRTRDFDDAIPKWQGMEDASEEAWKPGEGPSSTQGGEARPLPLITPTPPILASCHCGQTKLEAAAGPQEIYACHCRSCQQLTGSPYAWNCFFEPHKLRVAAGEAQLRAFRKDGSRRETFRCGRCLDRMVRHLEDDDGNLLRKVLPIGMVDKARGPADPAWQPRYHIWYGQRAFNMPDGLPKWSETKDSSEMLHD